ncbi:MAG TPA: hypothetical protein VFX35_02890 [Solirubrobacterales bacterium]|nr:hypothetical protein [Solirubrobacterales bacterium]
MSSLFISPAWLFCVQALYASGDPHLLSGVHLRVLLSFALGLPVAPLQVARGSAGSPRELGERIVPVFTDALGHVVFPTVSLRETGTVTAWLPSQPGNPVVWAAAVMDAADGKARVDAVLSGPLGPSVIASADRNPWQVCGTGIDRLVISGAGYVQAVQVVRAKDVVFGDLQPLPPLALPVADAYRYRGLEDSWDAALRRVERGSPRLVGLHDEPEAPDPGSCRALGTEEEVERVKALWGDRLDGTVEALLAQSPVSQQRLRMPPQSLSGPKVESTAVVPPLATVLQGALDPGLGRLLGFLDRDEEPPAQPGELAVYVVRGAFKMRWPILGRRLGWLEQARVEPPGPFEADELPKSVWDPGEGLFLSLTTVAAVVVGEEAPRPEPPLVRGGEDLGWVPETPPAARRHLSLRLGGLGPAATLAFARSEPELTGLNPRLPELIEGAPDRALPIVCGVPAELPTAAAASEPGQGEVVDRTAPAEAVGYRLAQADWFGRWSGWAETGMAPGTRPPVPAPLLEAAFLPPADPGDPGSLEVRCMQPRDDRLPPGGLPLETLSLSAEVAPGTLVSGSAAAERGPTPDQPVPLLVSFEVPALAVAERRTLTVTGVWSDSGGRVSEAGKPARAEAADPRAPDRLKLPDELDYASRPDALGRSRVRLAWPGAAPPTAYNLYRSDEPTLTQYLRDSEAGGAVILDQLKQAKNAPERAEVFRKNKASFDKAAFELLTATPLASTGGSMSHDDEVPGGLDVLVFYRVVPVGPLGAEAHFGECSLLVFGVPSAPAPPVPLLTAVPDPADPSKVRLTVTVPQGGPKAVKARLRRSRAGGQDPWRMPVVATVDLTGGGVEYLDSGPAPWAQTLRLAPWSTYTWRAEAQGEDEPGSSLAGAWSAPSAPASARIVPSAPPQPPAPGTARTVGSEVEVTFSAPEPLDAGSAGSYVVDVYRRAPAAAAVPSGAVGSFDAAGIRQPDGGYLVRDPVAAPPGTVYLVEIADPLDRRSPRTEVATL